ncbi:MAG: mannose-1-phosphate guanylyltransferase [Actinomycetota bacterium]
MPSTIPVILSGGKGTRLWPLSQEESPKQYHDLIGPGTLLERTIERIAELGERLVVIGHVSHVGQILDPLSRWPGGTVIAEPTGRNTAPAVAAAALLADPDDLLLVVPADHHIADRNAFLEAVRIAQSRAESGQLVTFGVVPTRVEEGYGYIVTDEASNDGGALRMERFVEKPAAVDAAALIDAGALWNSGMFLFRASVILEELDRHCPGVTEPVQRAIESAKTTDRVIGLGPEFGDAPGVPIDVAVMERTDHGWVVPLDAGWSDLGSWSGLWEIGDRDENDNVTVGRVVELEVSKSYIRSEGPLVGVVGMDDLIVVATPDAVLICPRSDPEGVKRLVAELARRQPG